MGVRGIGTAGALMWALVGGLALADRGAIVTVGDVDVAEPAQRAIIAYNGWREILILQTDVKADRETKVVEFMPLPSKPTVSLAPEGCFAALAEIIKAHNLRYVIKYRTKDGGEGAKEEAVNVVVTAHLGPHAVTVVEVKDADAFDRWVRAFFRTNALGVPALGASLRDIVSDYLARGIRFFAFDIVTLSPEKKTVQPLAYEFRSTTLYYPLVVSNLYGGRGTVELIIVAPRWLYLFRQPVIRPAKALFEGGRSVRWRPLYSTVATVSSAEQKELHPAIPGLLGQRSARLWAVNYDGPLQFDKDVQVRSDADSACGAFLSAIEAGDATGLLALSDVPFNFDRKEVVDTKEGLARRFDRLVEGRKGEARLRITAIKQMAPGELGQFDREFVEKHPRPRQVRIEAVTIGEETVIIFLVRRDRQWKVAGFSD